MGLLYMRGASLLDWPLLGSLCTQGTNVSPNVQQSHLSWALLSHCFSPDGSHFCLVLRLLCMKGQFEDGIFPFCLISP